MSQPLVSIIIVAFNSAEYITRCLNSLHQSTYQPLEIIIVDNGSKDATIGLIKKYSTSVKLIQSKTNHGYAQGNNIGASKAMGKYLFFLNPDTEVNKNFLHPLVKTLEHNENTVVAQPAVYLLSQRKQLNLTGKETHYLGMDWIKNYQATKTPSAHRIYSFSGSGFLISKEIFLQLGGFDPSYFMYYEDTDLSWRINLVGLKMRFVPQSKIFHDYKFKPQEQYQTLKQKLYYAERNRLLTLLKNYSLKTLFLLSPALILLEISLFAYSFISGWSKEKVDGYLSIFSLRQSILRKRKKIQENRLKSDKKIMRRMKRTINFLNYQHYFLTHILNPLFSKYYELVMLLL